MNDKNKRFIFICNVFTIFFTGISNAHVAILPYQSIQESYENFTVSVPLEKEIPTIKVEVKIPNNIDNAR